MTKKPEKEEKANVPAVQQAAQLPAELSEMYEAAAGAGTQNMTAQDMATPFLVILQSGSPQCKKSDAQYIEGAEEGFIFNTQTGEIFENGILFIQTGYSRAEVEWRDRDAGGGGLVAQYAPDHPIRQTTTKDEKGRFRLPNGNLLVTTAYHYGLLVSPDMKFVERVVIAMTSTQLKCSRQLNARLANLKREGKNGIYTPPTFSQIIKLTTSPRQKDKYSWFVWEFELVGDVTDVNVFREALEMSKAVANGAFQVTAPPLDHESDEPATLSASAAAENNAY